MIKARHAEEKDLDRVLDLLRGFHKASNYRWPLNEEGLMEFLKTTLELEPLGLFVAENDGVIIGALAASLTPLWFSWNILGAQEIFWWVDPKKRGKGVGKELFKFFERWAKDKDVDHIISSAIGSSPDHLGPFYEGLGFSKMQSNWVKEL